MIGEMMVIMTRLILENHIYQFKGKLYLQTSGGGPIGLKLTGVLARIVMHFFDQKYLATLKVLKIIPILYKRYVDDLNMALKVKKAKEGE